MQSLSRTAILFLVLLFVAWTGAHAAEEPLADQAVSAPESQLELDETVIVPDEPISSEPMSTEPVNLFPLEEPSYSCPIPPPPPPAYCTCGGCCECRRCWNGGVLAKCTS